jgi:hypothetical protein
MPINYPSRERERAPIADALARITSHLDALDRIAAHLDALDRIAAHLDALDRIAERERALGLDPGAR